MSRHLVLWSEFKRQRERRYAETEQTAAALTAEITTCNCGAPLLAGDRYQCPVCRDRGIGIAITNLERDRERRERDGSGWRPGMRICYAQECYPPLEPPDELV